MIPIDKDKNKSKSNIKSKKDNSGFIDIVPLYKNTDETNDLSFDMTGGRVIGEGGYGCVFKPAINCNGKESKGDKYITKIQLESDTSDREIEIGNIVRKIPMSNKHFAPIVSNCPSKLNTIINIMRNHSCSFINKNPYESFAISKIPAINGDDFKRHIYTLSKSEDILHNIIHSYVYLLFSIYLLNKNGVIHYDLKGENVMYDIDKKRPIIIDFGLSIEKNKIKPDFNNPNYMDHLTDYFYVYAPDYQLWCLDIHYLCFLTNYPGKNVEPKIESMVDTYMENNRALKSLSEQFKKQYRKMSIKQLKKYAKMGTKKAVQYLYDHCDTWDNYSLSIMFIRLLKVLKGNDTIANQHNEFLEFFEMLLCMNIHPIPDERISIKKTHDYMVSYLNKSVRDTKIFQQIINGIEKDKKNIKRKLKKQINHDDAVSYKMSLFKSKSKK